MCVHTHTHAHRHGLQNEGIRSNDNVGNDLKLLAFRSLGTALATPAQRRSVEFLRDIDEAICARLSSL